MTRNRVVIGRIEAADLARVYAAAYVGTMALGGITAHAACGHAEGAMRHFAETVEDMAKETGQ